MNDIINDFMGVKYLSLRLVLGVFLFCSNCIYAKVCPELPALNLQQCGHYDFIAYGRVDEQINCDEGSVLFAPISVFKGISDDLVKVLTNCSDNGIPMSKGEYWLVFGKKNNAQEINVSICEHSRLQFPEGEIDYLLDIRGSSFHEDLSFLKDNFKKKIVGEKELLAKKYEKISPLKTLILLSSGFVFMLVGFFVIRRMK